MKSRGNRKSSGGMEKKKKLRASSGGDESGGGGFSTVLPHDLMAEEVLTRLPAKSLMRFKCVSKLWRSTILDPSFCKAHRARSRSLSGGGADHGLLIVCPDHNLGLGFFVATPSRPNRDGVFDSLHHHFTLSGREFDGATDVGERGLVCLYTLNRPWLCSVSTGEIMELPPPPPPSSENCAHYIYYLGYDYIVEKFKVLRVCWIRILRYSGYDFYVSECEILTVGSGEESWRSLDGAPAIYLGNESSVYVNGARYWWHSTGRHLVRLSFQDEEFQIIDLPPRVIPQLRGFDPLHEFRGRLALVTGLKDRNLQLWLLWSLRCEEEEEEEEEAEDKWFKHAIHIPYAFADQGCTLIGNLPTGFMLMTGAPAPTSTLEEAQDVQDDDEEEITNYSKSSPLMAMPPIYSYDLLFGKFNEFVVGNKLSSTSLLSSSIGKDTSNLRIYYYKEDITPLNHWISNIPTDNY